MAGLSKEEIEILRITRRTVMWRRFTRPLEFVLGVALVIFTFWVASDRELFEWFTGGGGVFGMLGALGGAATVSAVRNWGYSRNQLLLRLAQESDESAA